MPWKEVSTMSQRKEFIVLATQPARNIRALCRAFSISPKTGYKWLARYAAEGEPGLQARSRRPQQMPQRTAAVLEQAILHLRTAHPTWGGRKLHARLQTLGYAPVPAPSTITAILRRHGRLAPVASSPAAWHRFEHATPNALWQMDFKGHFPVGPGRCHPLTILDDCSRFALCLQACANEQTATVQAHLIATFRRYGLPARLLMDNGAPWGDRAGSPFTPLTVWCLRLGIGISHARPAHPQTLGKDERFHRTLKAELLHQRTFRDLAHCQQHFDQWRALYNLDRPHEALAMAVPAARYQPSPRPFPETLPPIEYGATDIVRKVQAQGELSYRGRIFRVSKAFRGYPVALRPTPHDGLWRVYFCHQHVADLDLHRPTS